MLVLALLLYHMRCLRIQGWLHNKKSQRFSWLAHEVGRLPPLRYVFA